ncbi:bifunctional hydroxymethylpyrimidine kinase/phosphomethylpyrimidine kinase [Leptospira bandrabouensis]|uniref:bifunctional hydroxymethylpyrimidine kinase/phosphomethylpyrimidine kinase n=1 Tax=Leptospira bandrabouensis TaxID=2484903 RepID=UPI001EE89B69|nr:bifunctional hydroxymethylpyrimidine kinase/phosphomethylpyrimidine kinase [Leptospira bandrabouensis]MCG6143451.1 bifunctional hydroxymethylpyrimidine kinase/phosphomethylpyrimidine kinase [Leptospira bandrabouensis]MCG6151507.1 bifunctional hydroxymethylpyrimidine kinase/phosphomethylpyrimidine kinase [Leptospira bandrabouensis]MCG6159111.1 bifunctional hydroxymethylpyrimidine kinase/phosphomethylpyrimidine kinase [Leptospira bandrabouensis]MCG6163045.1 bifunctional hydroxymethylpyrimidine
MKKDFPITLTIAGSDSGGGAGVQADLKTFSSLATFGTTVFTCLTAQNPDGVSGISEISPDFVSAQLKAVAGYFPVKAAKTGMLYSANIIQTVSEFFYENPDIQLVVDPVMVATSGAKLLKDDAIQSLTKDLLPLAKLITPNLDEASLLLGESINQYHQLVPMAEKLFQKYKVPFLLKGGHLPNAKEATDVLFDGKSSYVFSKPFLKGKNTHGTGCTYSAAITSFLAHGKSLPEAVGSAKEYLHLTLEDEIKTGPIYHLNHFPEPIN